MDGITLKLVRALFALVVMFAPSAFAQVDGGPAEAAWRRAWREARNREIDARPDMKFDATSVLVRFEPGLPEASRAALRSAVGAGSEPIARWTILPDVEQLHLPARNAEQAVERLARMPGVAYAELDHVIRLDQTPNDTGFGVLWGLHNTGQTVNVDPGIAGADINAPEAWDITTGSPDFVIAIIDSGFNYNHPDLAANAWLNPGEIAGNGIDDDGNGYVDDMRGWDFYSNDSDPMDDNGHGTHCGGTIGGVGNNGLGVAGVNWQCKMMGLKFLGSGGSGSTSGAVSAVNYLVGKGVKVSNNSWGGGGFSQTLYDAIAASRAIGHVFVAAAGNNNTNTDGTAYYPQGYALDNIISVAASDNNDQRASFSNYGGASVDLAAPGVNIYSTYTNTPTGTSYAYLNGTSMATPHVTGVVALVQSLHADWTYSQVRGRILATVRPVAAFSSITATGGVLDAYAAVNDGAPINTAPSVAISSPANGTLFAQGATISFAATASDVEDGTLTSSLAWTSNIDGAIGSGGSFSRTLSTGTHSIVASVADSGGRSGAGSVTITVSAPAPGNDACSGAIALADGVSASGSTQWATNDGTASCGSSSTSPDVWFTYSTSGSGSVVIDTCGSSFDTVVSVYTGSCDALTQIACNDDNGSAGPCPGGLTSYVAFTSTGGTTYRIRVAGYASATGSYVVRAAGGQTDLTPPSVPGGLVALAGNGSVSLDWNPSSESDVAGYRVYRSTVSGGPYGELTGAPTTATGYEDASVVNGTTFHYVVAAQDFAGNLSAYSLEASATPDVPPAPVALFIDGFESGNLVAGGWSVSSSADAFASTAAAASGSWGARVRKNASIQRVVSTAGFRSIELRYTRRTAGYDSGETLLLEWWDGVAWYSSESTAATAFGTQVFALPSGAENLASFTVRIRSKANRTDEWGDVDGVEVWGVPTSGGGDITPPAPPSNLVATPGDTTVVLDWAASSSFDTVGYRVYRATNVAGPFTEITSAPISALAFVDTVVINGATYYYSVTAEDAAGNESSPSNQVSATPFESVPPVLLFSDGFESGDFAVGGWVRQNSNASASTGAASSGSWGARLVRATWIEKSISTAGHAAIELRFARRTAGLDNGEFLAAEWWDGVSWLSLGTTNATAFGNAAFALPAAAAGSSTFKFRLRVQANRSDEWGDVDAVELWGVPTN